MQGLAVVEGSPAPPRTTPSPFHFGGASRNAGLSGSRPLYGDGKHVFQWALQGEKGKMEKKPEKESRMGAGIAIGIAIGLAIGVALDNIAIGIPLGVAIGAGIGAWWDRQRKMNDGSGQS
jgi:hypothetical protein